MDELPDYCTRASLGEDLHRIGLRGGDTVLVHAAMRRVGPILNGPDTLTHAMLDAVGPTGTIMVYTSWESRHEYLLDEEGCVLPEWRDHVPPFDPATARAIRINGAIAECLRTTPGACRSSNPSASMAAIGARADWLTADHPMDYGYGPGSPLAKLVEVGGRILMVGAPWSKCTVVHYAEHIARLPDKIVVRFEVPLATPAGTQWRFIEEFETDDPVSDALPANHIHAIVSAFVERGNGSRGTIGAAPSLLMEAPLLLRFAVDWMEAATGSASA